MLASLSSSDLYSRPPCVSTPVLFSVVPNLSSQSVYTGGEERQPRGRDHPAAVGLTSNGLVDPSYRTRTSVSCAVFCDLLEISEVCLHCKHSSLRFSGPTRKAILDRVGSQTRQNTHRTGPCAPTGRYKVGAEVELRFSPSLVLGHVLSPVRFLPRHSFLLIANYTS